MGFEKIIEPTIAGVVGGGATGFMGGPFSEVTVPAGALIGGAVGLVGGVLSYFNNPDTNITNANNYTTQNTTQVSNNEIIIGSNSKIGQVSIKDDLVANQTAKQSQDLSSGLSTRTLLISGAVAGAVYLWRSKR